MVAKNAIISLMGTFMKDDILKFAFQGWADVITTRKAKEEYERYTQSVVTDERIAVATDVMG